VSRRSTRRRLVLVLSSIVILLASSTALALPLVEARAADAPAQDVYAFGGASFYGSAGAIALTEPIVGMESTPTDRGYWLVASDGGVFSFGDARFFGSTGGLRLIRPIVGMAASPTGHGYRFVASDGGIFSFGDATYHGSLGAAGRVQPVVAMDTTPSGNGYWLAAADGTVSGFGDATRLQPLGDVTFPSSQRAIGMTAGSTGRGYWLASTPAHPTNPKVEAAIGWFLSRTGMAAYTGQCELAVENAFGTESVYANAFANWQAQPVKHTDWQNAPRGALVFYDTSSDGHVAISLGDGTVASTSVNSRIGVVAASFFQNPIGWTESPFL
jgi:hypothetical protein